MLFRNAAFVRVDFLHPTSSSLCPTPYLKIPNPPHSQRVIIEGTMLSQCLPLAQYISAWIIFHVPPEVAVDRRKTKSFYGGPPDPEGYAEEVAVVQGEAAKWDLVRDIVRVSR